jgi:DNA-binding LytR/AlgR family response regulator
MNCIIIDDHKLSRDILEKHLSKFEEVELVAQFENPSEALSFLKKNTIDLIFLDVEMPEMTGMQFLEYLDGSDHTIILTTSHTEFAIDAFKHNVSGYLIKPIKFDQFSLALKKALNKKDSSSENVSFKEKLIFIKEGKSIIKINKSDVKLIECIGDYVSLYCKGKKFIIHSSMKGIEKRLPSQDYMRVHRSFIVRLDAIDDIENNSISIENKIIPIGKTYRTTIYKHLNIL